MGAATAPWRVAQPPRPDIGEDQVELDQFRRVAGIHGADRAQAGAGERNGDHPL